MSDTTPLKDPVEEAHRVVEAANEASLQVKLMGGIGIRTHSESVTEPAFDREFRDIDFVSIHEHRKDVIELMMELGYENNERINQMHRFRLEFFDPVNDRKADYIIDRFEFCHQWNLRNRINRDDPTIPIEDLLLSKLQIVEISARDLRDIILMLRDHPVENAEDTDIINPHYIAKLCSSDWGLYKTTTMNLDRVDEHVRTEELPVESSTITSRTESLRRAIEETPKTWRWKLRSLIGERKQWYNRPELT